MATLMTTQIGWTVERILPWLLRSKIGQEDLRLLEQFAEQLHVYRSPCIRNWYRYLGQSEWLEYRLYGLTRGMEPVEVFLSASMDDFTAAATLVHELEHARGRLTGVGGTETDARTRDLAFYQEFGALERLPSEYFEKGVVRRDEFSGFVVDFEALRVRSETAWNGSCEEYEIQDYIIATPYRIDGFLREHASRPIAKLG